MPNVDDNDNEIGYRTETTQPSRVINAKIDTIEELLSLYLI